MGHSETEEIGRNYGRYDIFYSLWAEAAREAMTSKYPGTCWCMLAHTDTQGCI